jgi:hypothetical protein
MMVVTAQSYLKIDVSDRSAQYLDALEKCAEQELRALGKERAKLMESVAAKKTGAMSRGAASEFSRRTGLSAVEMGGTERKTAWLEYGVHAGRARRGRARKAHKAQPWVIPSLRGADEAFSMGLIFRAEKIKDMV